MPTTLPQKPIEQFEELDVPAVLAVMLPYSQGPSFSIEGSKEKGDLARKKRQKKNMRDAFARNLPPNVNPELDRPERPNRSIE